MKILRNIFLTLKVLFLSAAFFSSAAYSQQICPLNGMNLKPKGLESVEVLKGLAVLEHGRVKPFDTYAKNVLLQLSGRTSYQKQPAFEWVAKLIFAPQVTREDQVFLINHSDIPKVFGIEPQKRRRYSYAQLQPHIPRIYKLAQEAHQIEQRKRDLVETEILRLFESIQLYTNLSLTFSFAFPHPDFTLMDSKTKEVLGFQRNITQFSFLQFAKRSEQIAAMTKVHETKPADQWTKGEQELIQIVAKLYQWSMAYYGLPLNIVPSYLPKDENWYSPWDATHIALQFPQGREELDQLEKILMTYWNGELLEFNLAVKAFDRSVEQRTENRFPGFKNRLRVELIYNKLNLFFISKTIYFLVFLLFLIGMIQRKKGAVYSISLVLLSAAFVAHAVAIMMRMYILQRAPVSNLYETFIFVAFVSVLGGLFIERFHKHWLGIVTASVSGYIFLVVASKFASDGDTMQMLVAVLNSQFWLSTHVLTITIGYAGVCMAGVIGHVFLLQAIFGRDNLSQLKVTYSVLLGMLGFGLVMTFLGTTLGGIWADQSWGRFWGWDPKENGALMIVLWCALLFHAKIARILGPVGMAVGSILAIIVVMWAWFGVNLLSVGLHSYGFTSGLAMKLAVYFIAQTGVLIVLFLLVKKKYPKLTL
ncbi:MAG: cytochrome c biogenesis protein CcsA [Candidatus Omnitrophica bacterium]|nr:cytochrome c biogenesis protein CcsA [Candidatus Omnitrophota bacterium]